MNVGSSKHGNIMMLNKPHNDGKGAPHQGASTIGGHQKTQSQGFTQQHPGALLSNFTKGASLPQHPNSTTNNRKYFFIFIPLTIDLLFFAERIMH
jgi:hypothetical protein